MSNPLDNLQDYRDLMQDPEFHEMVAEIPLENLIESWDNFRIEEAVKIFSLLSIEKKVDLLNDLPHTDQEELIQAISAENAKIILEEMEPDDLTDFIQSLSPKVREQIWNNLSEEVKHEAQFLLKYDEDDAAGLMTPKYLALRSSLTVAQALNWVRRKAREVETVYNLYIINNQKRLIGVISLRDILVLHDSDKIEEHMVRDVISVNADTDQEEVAKILERNDFLTLPVVDSYNRLLGIVTVDDVIEVIREEQTEDIYKMSAMDGNIDRYLETSIPGLVKKRIPWLSFLLIAATFTTNVLAYFEGLFTMTALVLFIPTIVGTGGNSGSQSAALMIRGLATGEIRFNDIWKILGREIFVGLIMGVCMALLIILRSMVLPPAISLPAAFAVGISLGLVIIVATIVGAMMPLIIHRLGFDPTVMAGPFMATIIDISGLTIYFISAKLILGM